MSIFDQALAYAIANEGTTYVNNPADKGGPTKFGITLQTLRGWKNDASLQADAVKALALADAGAIYKAQYWAPLKADSITDASAATALFDASVLNGVLTVVKALQKDLIDTGAMGMTADGIIGPKTLGLINQRGAQYVCPSVSFAMQLRAVKIVTADPAQRIFLRTWLRRACAYFELSF